MDTAKFKNPSGAFYLKQIFFETATDSDRPHVLYTLKDEDHTFKGVTYPSLRRLYLEEGDETEYLVATKYFGGWPHWRRLLSCTWFVDYLSEYREELSIRQAFENVRALREKAKTGDYQSNKFLLEGSWKGREKVGRPSKAKIKEEANKLFKNSEEITDDLDRITRELDSVSYS